MDNLQIFVNEKKVTISSLDVPTDLNLANFLRNELSLTGTKVSCGIGGCGSCTVLISRYFPEKNIVRHCSVNACITPLYTLHGAHILTVEGLSDSESYHEIQKALAFGNGTQCGYCSPGFVMSMLGVQAEDDISCSTNSTPCISKIKTALQGNLCRCTGYRPILEAFYQRSLCKSNCETASDKCCSSQADIEDTGKVPQKLPDPEFCIEKVRKVNSEKDSTGILNRIEGLLKLEGNAGSMTPLKQFTTSTKSTWIVPTSLDELKQVLKRNNRCKIVAGGTSDEFWKSVTEHCGTVVDVSKVTEMRCVEFTNDFLRLGASLTIADMQKEIKFTTVKLLDSKLHVLKALSKMIQVYASRQVKRSATIGGSLMVASTASDFQTAFHGFGLKSNIISLEDSTGESYNIVQSIDINFADDVRSAWYEKIRRRKDFDLALVNVAVSSISKEKGTFETTFSFGGTLLRRCTFHKESSVKIDEDLKSPAFTGEITQLISNHICQEQLKLNSSIESFVQATVTSLLTKFGIYLKKSEDDELYTGVFKATRIFTKPTENQASYDLVHRQVPHASAIKHVTGEAKYCDDIPKFKNELELAFVLSTRPHAKLLNVDFSEALKIDGVVGSVTHQDIQPGRNKFGMVERDEEVFASEKVTCNGQIIAGIVATSREIAIKATTLVKVEYEDLQPVLFTSEDAIKHNSFYSTYDLKLTKGDCDTVFEQNDVNVLAGEVKIGSQEHFYMEVQSCIVIPKGEDGEMEVISSTQNPTGVQREVSHVLNVHLNSVVVRVKRVGGAFGGKESRCFMIAVPAAVAAKKFGRPVRCVLPRDTDMKITGQRGKHLTKHKVAFDNNGKLCALRMTVYIGAGNSIDVTMAELQRIIVGLENAYNIPNVDFKGYICKTNVASSTVFRGTGAPPGVFLMENIMDMVSTYLNKEPSQVRALQLYQQADFTPYGQPLEGSTIQACWDECLQNSKYFEKKKIVGEFNRENGYRKRGICVNPINYGVGYVNTPLNQGAALVHIYTDGTVLVSHCGVELGQGIHTKMIQVATRALGIPSEKIKILDTATDRIPNLTATSASMATDLNGPAVMNACLELKNRLKPYQEKNPEGSWEDIITQAYFDRVSLSSTGYYKVPDVGWETKPQKGTPWSYFSSGAACTVVELDCLTGQFQILSTDIVMDVGKSLNPSVDLGQIEGAFMQGVGLFLLEELVYDETGKLCTAGPVTYKIPAVNDTPLEFNVSFLLGPGNPKAIYSSKAIGEPPLLLATSAFFAVKDAIRAYRSANGKDVNFRLDSPATVEKILLACHTIFD